MRTYDKGEKKMSKDRLTVYISKKYLEDYKKLQEREVNFSRLFCMAMRAYNDMLKQEESEE